MICQASSRGFLQVSVSLSVSFPPRTPEVMYCRRSSDIPPTWANPGQKSSYLFIICHHLCLSYVAIFVYRIVTIFVYHTSPSLFIVYMSSSLFITRRHLCLSYICHHLCLSHVAIFVYRIYVTIFVYHTSPSLFIVYMSPSLFIIRHHLCISSRKNLFL